MTAPTKILLIGVSPEEVLDQAPDLRGVVEFCSDPVLAHQWSEGLGVEFQAMIVASESQRHGPASPAEVVHTAADAGYEERTQVSQHRWLILRGQGPEDFRVVKFSPRGLDTLRRLLESESEGFQAESTEGSPSSGSQDDGSRLQSEFVSNISHEFRTPLNGILGYVGLLRDGLYGPVTREQDEALGHIRRCATHLLDLINEILDLGKIKNDKLELDKDLYSPYELIRSVADAMQPAVREKGLNLIVRCKETLPPVYVDFHRIYQVLKNLLDNAVKFTQTGEVEIGARRIRGAIEFYVRDTGIGIPAHSLSSIFEEFRQADGSTTRHYGGIGIGLSLSRRLVELHGGTMQVESRPHRGSTFSFRIPLVEVQSKR